MAILPLASDRRHTSALADRAGPAPRPAGIDMAEPEGRWHIMSYPRSGSHAVRAIIESCSGRPTMGCPGIRSDPPIHAGAANRAAGLIRITDDRPIGYKAHFPHQIVLNERLAGAALGLVLVVRDPVDAIASHAYRIVGRRWLASERRITKIVVGEVDRYLALLHLYRSMHGRPRIVVRYEDITAEPPIQRLVAARNLLEAMDIDASGLSLDRLHRTLDVARQSQFSLRRVRTGLMARIRAMTQDVVAPGLVESLIFDDAEPWEPVRSGARLQV